MLKQAFFMTTIGGITYEAETLTLLANMLVQPTLELKTLINTTYKTLKDAGILPKLDVLTLYPMHTPQAALLDWKGYKDASAVGNISFVPGMGFKNRDGLARYINTNYNPATNGVNYILNDAMFGVFTKDYDDNRPLVYMGTRHSSIRYALLYGNMDTSGGTIGYVNASLGASPGVGGYGMACLERNSSSNIRLIMNGTSNFGDVRNYSTVIPSGYPMWVGAGGPEYSAVGYNRTGFQASFTGASLSDAEHLIFNAAIKNFVDNAPATFTPKTDYLDVVNDGNTVAWYDASVMSTITKDGADAVSRWNDQLGSGRDLLQATGTNQPTWSTDGVLFDGVDNFMRTNTFPLEQPEFVYMVVKQPTWSVNDAIFDGSLGSSGLLLKSGTTPQIKASAGTYSGATGLAVDAWGIIRVLFNGAGSKLIVNNLIPTTWNCGANNMNGFTLGNLGVGTGYGNIQVKEIIIRKVSDDILDEELIYNYFKTKYFSTDLVLYDGDTWAWYDSEPSTATMTIVGDASVSRWNDKLKSGHDLIQNTSTNRPTWSTDGVLFDGSVGKMQTATSPLCQPEMIYAVFKQPTWTAQDCLMDGFTANTGYLQQTGATPQLRTYAGTGLGNVTLPLDTFGIVRIKLNGISSSIQINSSTAVVGNAGAAPMNGITLGAPGTGTIAFSNVQFKEIIIRSVVDTSTNEAFIYDYLKTRYSL